MPQAPFPPECAARFTPVAEIGRGGQGVVYTAIQRSLGRQVVVKLLAERVEDADAVRRFETEAKLTARLRHPHVVVLIDHQVEDGVPWIAYEYVPGESLAHLLAARKLDLAAIVRAVAQVAGALEAAHARGILHRDVKAENVLCDGAVSKLADFGIATLTARSDAHTRTGVVVGTPHHLAPERATGAPATARTDLYALGILLFQALTGRFPFAESSHADILRAHTIGGFPPPSRFNAQVPPALDAVFARATERDPALRYALAEAMRRDLEAVLEQLSTDAGAATAIGPVTEPLSVVPGVVPAVVPGGVPAVVPGVAPGVVPAVVPAVVRRPSPRRRPVGVVLGALVAGLGVGALLRPAPRPAPTAPARSAPASAVDLGPVRATTADAVARFAADGRAFLDPMEARLQPDHEDFEQAGRLAAQLARADDATEARLSGAVSSLEAALADVTAWPEDALAAGQHARAWHLMVWLRREHARSIVAIAAAIREKGGGIGMPELHERLFEHPFDPAGVELVRRYLAGARVARMGLAELLDDLHRTGTACGHARWSAVAQADVDRLSRRFAEGSAAGSDVDRMVGAAWRWGFDGLAGRGVRAALEDARRQLVELGRAPYPDASRLTALAGEIAADLARRRR